MDKVKKLVRDKEVAYYLATGWQLVVDDNDNCQREGDFFVVESATPHIVPGGTEKKTSPLRR